MDRAAHAGVEQHRGIAAVCDAHGIIVFGARRCRQRDVAGFDLHDLVPNSFGIGGGSMVPFLMPLK